MYIVTISTYERNENDYRKTYQGRFNKKFSSKENARVVINKLFKEQIETSRLGIYKIIKNESDELIVDIYSPSMKIYTTYCYKIVEE